MDLRTVTPLRTPSSAGQKPCCRSSTGGAGVGLVTAIALTQWMSSLLFGVGRLDPATYTVVLGVLMMAAAMASYVPARRAAAVDPVETLTAE